MNPKKDIIELCCRRSTEIENILSLKSSDDEDDFKKRIIRFFKALTESDLPGIEYEEDISAYRFHYDGKIKCLGSFKVYYEKGEYSYAIMALSDYIRNCYSLFEVGAREMLIEAGRQVLKDDFPL